MSIQESHSLASGLFVWKLIQTSNKETINDLVLERHNSIVNALELHLALMHRFVITIHKWLIHEEASDE